MKGNVRRVVGIGGLGLLFAAGVQSGAGCGRSDDVIGGAGGGAASTANAGGAAPENNWREDFEACAEVREEASLVPVNMLLTVDKSGSMDDGMPVSKWEAATSAFTAFFEDPAAAGLRVALRLWPDDSDGCNDDDCDAAACGQPQVALGSLGDATHSQALIDALEMTVPEGGTPVSAALDGALVWAQAQLAAAPSEQAVIVLVTDGEPNGCDENIDNIAAIAASAFAAGAPVFVVGIEGSNEMQIDQIATAGGTDAGYFVGSANAEAELLAAMQDIQGKSVSCTFAYPQEEPDQPLSPDLMRIEYTSGSEVIRVPRVEGPEACTAEGGWYLDDPANPMTITLCPETCNTVQGDVQARIDVAVGCECEVDSDCPAGNVCEDHRCVPPCQTDADCPTGEICNDGHCIPEPGDPCVEDPDCPAPLVCIGGQCSLGEVFVGGEEAVQGGAFACAVTATRFPSRAAWLALLAGAALFVARRRHA